MKFIWAIATHPGLVRDSNQDSVLPTSGGTGPGPLLVAVADGMGGHAGGEVASRLAIETIVADPDIPVNDRVVKANEVISAESLADPVLAGMGTTVSVVEIQQDGAATIGHVGDSRVYLLRSGRLQQLTTDHTLVARWVAEGRLTQEQAAVHPQRSMLMRAVGHGRPLQVDVIEERLTDGDRLMICSDGLSGMINDELIFDLLSQGTAEESVWALVEAANRAGGHDNITVAAVDVES
ncbi:MAG: protein phosphatase 2C domain-containing protein [Acidimicrobiia bacterium]|nr:protein phosphatase 2C domain-containing protein [Acidimicrobiia bacterium]